VSAKGGSLRRVVKRLAFATLVFILLAAAIEGFFRAWPVTRDKGKIFNQAPDGAWFFSLTDSGIFFREPKPEGTFRIMCFGESAVEGSIYNPVSTFPKHLGLMLQGQLISGRVEVINCGKTGITSTDLRDLVMSSFRFQPDLMIVYCGNNELTHYKPINAVETPILFPIMHFLARHSRLLPVLSDKIYSLKLVLGGAVILKAVPDLNVSLTRFPPERREHIKQNFVRNLEAVVLSAKQRNVPLILCTVAGNLRDWPPQRSRYPEAMPVPERLSLEQQCRDAEAALAQGRVDEAARLFDGILQKAPDHARAHFWRGRLALKRGDLPAARREFILAGDEDDSGINRPQSYDNEEVVKLARESNTPLLDLASLFNEKSPYGLTGFELINDGCHPTIAGQVFLAANLAAFIAQEFPDRFAPPDADALIARKEQWLKEEGVTTEFLAKRTQEMAFNLGFGYDDRLINDQAIILFHDLMKLTPDSTLPWASIGLLRLRQDDAAAGAAALAAALELNPSHLERMSRLYLKHYLRWDDPYLLVRARPGLEFASILRDYLEATGVVISGKPFVLPLSDADRAYRWEAAALNLVDVTAPLKDRLAQRDRIRAGAAKPSALVICADGAPRAPLMAQRMASSGPGEFSATSADPALIFSGLAVNPLLLDQVSVRAAISPLERQVVGELCLYWKSAGIRFFGEDRKACSPLKPDGAAHDYTIDLSSDPDWLMSQGVEALRLDPGESRVKLRLDKIEFRRSAPDQG
jgi:tetratricopeptide (TPR) repeat protein